MMNEPYFSIVIPTFNRAGHILKAIDSVLRQGYGQFEVIVVDDGSTDDTGDLITSVSDPRVSYYKTENRERGAARNYGARLARGQYINFLDSDDILLPHHLLTAVKFAEAHANPPIFSFHFEILSRDGKSKSRAPRVHDIKRQLLRGNYLSCNGVFVRTDIMIENPFREDRALASLEDWELWIRLAARYPFLHSPEVTSFLMVHEERSVLSRNTEVIERKVDAFMNCIIADQTIQDVYGSDLRKALASALSYASLHLAMARAPGRVVIRYLWRAVQKFPAELFRLRTMAVVKLFLVNLVSK